MLFRSLSFIRLSRQLSDDDNLFSLKFLSTSYSCAFFFFFLDGFDYGYYGTRHTCFLLLLQFVFFRRTLRTPYRTIVMGLSTVMKPPFLVYTTFLHPIIPCVNPRRALPTDT